MKLYETLQFKEINKILFLELKIFEYLVHCLKIIQINTRNVIALWAEALGLNEEDKNRCFHEHDDGDDHDHKKDKKDKNKNTKE
jgi:hypothetical protein